MKKILSLLSALMISAGLAFAQPAPVVPLRLYDEGVSRGYVTSINCVGSGIVCTASAYAGVITISAGSSGIATDGSSTTTATIPFAQGIDVTGSIDGDGDTTALFIHVPLAQTAFAGRVDGYYTDGWRFDGEWKTNNASISNAFTFQDSTVWAPTATLQNGWAFGASPVVKGSVNGGYLYGMLSSPFTASSGSTYSGVMSSVAAFEAQQFIGSGTFTNYYMYHGQQLGGSGTITNMYGLYLPAITKGGTLNYAIYTNGGLVRFGDNVSTTGSVTAGSLTSGRVPIASTGGLLVDDADLTFATDTLSATKIASSSLTSGRVPIASTSGLLVDDSDFTFATDTLTVTKISATTHTGILTFADGINIATNTTTGSSFGNATTQKVSVYGVAPVAQQANTVDIRTALINFGVFASGGANPLNLNGGALTANSGTFGSINNSGGINLDWAAKSADYTLTPFDFFVTFDASGAARTANIPSIAGNNRRLFVITKIDSSSNAVTLDPNSSETINGSTTFALRNQYDSVLLQNNTGTDWTILASNMQKDGVYTPTRSAEANMDSNVTMTQAQYVRVGNVVTVSGRFTADPTLTATTTSFEITLPVSSNLGAAEDAAGVAFSGAIAGQGAMVLGVAANDTAKIQWLSGDVTSQVWSYTFTYRII